MRIRDTDETSEATLNLAPMIDVVFLLLIFFMVATTFVEKEKEMSVDLPLADSGAAVDHPAEEIVINLTADGRILVGGVETDRDGLLETLQRAARRDAETPVTIRGDKRAYHEQVVGVMDVCRLAGLTNLGLMTLDS